MLRAGLFPRRHLLLKLVSEAFSAIAYDAVKPQSLLDEDRVIGAMRLGIKPDSVTITLAAQLFAN